MAKSLIQVVMSPKLKATIRREAKAAGHSMSGHVRLILDDAFKKKSK